MYYQFYKNAPGAGGAAGIGDSKSWINIWCAVLLSKVDIIEALIWEEGLRTGWGEFLESCWIEFLERCTLHTNCTNYTNSQRLLQKLPQSNAMMSQPAVEWQPASIKIPNSSLVCLLQKAVVTNQFVTDANANVPEYQIGKALKKRKIYLSILRREGGGGYKSGTQGESCFQDKVKGFKVLYFVRSFDVSRSTSLKAQKRFFPTSSRDQTRVQISLNVNWNNTETRERLWAFNRHVTNT